MKTLKELTEMISKYESKWGKLGHTNIMNPELNHSGIDDNTKKGENKTMSRMNNDLIAFRQKVAAGKERNKLVHRSTIDVNSLNEMNYEQLMKSHTLIHAQNPLYGQQNPNAKYYKREGEPGKYRYYYTKEEYDAAHKQGNAQTEANKEAQARQQYENNKKAANNNGPSKFNNMRADVVNEYAKIAREASSKDAAKAFYDMAKGGNEAIDELYSAIQDGFKSGKLSYKDGRFETDDDQLREDIEAFSDNIQKFAKQIGEASGKGREIQDELEKLMLPDIEAMSNKAEARKDLAKKAQSGREAAEKAGQKAAQELQAKEEQLKKDLDSIKTLNHETEVLNKKKKSKSDHKYEVAKNIQNEMQEGASKWMEKNGRQNYQEFVEEFNKAAKEYGFDAKLIGNGDYVIHPDGDTSLKEADKCYSDIDKYKKNIDDCINKLHNISNKYDKASLEEEKALYERNIVELECRIQDLYMKNDQECKKVFDEILNHMNNDILYEKKLYENILTEAKHSTSGKALITNSAMGDELMDEYSAFQAKVKAGKERNRLAHSTTISPAELNSRYEKELESKGILVHGGNYKYYNKIDLPNGTTRYFYTKAEWDAYREGNERSKYEQQKKNFENNKKAAEAEGDRYKKPEQKPLPKSATMTDEERKEMYEDLAKKAKIHNQQVKNYENNKKAAEAEGERMAQKYAAMNVVKDLKKDIENAPKDIENPPEPEQKPEVPALVEEQINKEVKQETRNIEEEAAKYTETVLMNMLEDKDLIDYFNKASWHSIFGDSENQMKDLNEWYNNVFTPKLEATIEEAYNLYGPEYVEILSNNINDLFVNIINEYKTAYAQQRMALYGY